MKLQGQILYYPYNTRGTNQNRERKELYEQKELKLKLLQGLGEALKENGYKTRITQQSF